MGKKNKVVKKTSKKSSKKVAKTVSADSDDWVIKALVLPKALSGLIEKASAPGSKRIRQDKAAVSVRGTARLNETKIRIPPTDLEILARTTLISSRLAKSIDIMAKNVVGLGFEIIDVLSVPERRNVKKRTLKKIEEQSTNLFNFLENANDDKTFEELMRLVQVDYEAVGNGYKEVTRDNEDKIFGLGHLPGRSMRIRKDKEGFVQIRGDKVRFFVPFEKDPKKTLAIDPLTGEELKGTFTREDMATEVIHFKQEHPSDDFYGIPRWFPAIPAITGNRLADIRNIKFMENDATPRMAILITGGNLDPASVEAITSFMDIQGKGVENASRVMVLQAERKMIGPQAGEPPKIELKPLTVGIEDDASFLKYRQANNDEIKEVFGISDLFYGMSRDINRAAASVSKQVTNEQEFEPERKRISHVLKHKLLPALSFETDLVTIKFNAPLINDLSSLADGLSKAAAAGGLTPNDIKRMIGQPHYPKTPEYDWADYPMPIATLFIELGLFGLTDNVDDMPERQPKNRKPKPEGETEEEEDEEEEKSIMSLAFKGCMERIRGDRTLRKRLMKKLELISEALLEENEAGD